MSYNNGVYPNGRNGGCAGFRCYECGKVFQSMWGDTCNGCGEVERCHNEMILAIQSNKKVTQ